MQLHINVEDFFTIPESHGLSAPNMKIDNSTNMYRTKPF